MKYQIMIDILISLLAKRKLTARQIADKHEISTRSVYRYIEELNVCGVPVDVARGRYGGITIADTFRLPAGYFTRDEYSSTLNALNAMMSQVDDSNLQSAYEKLQRQQKSEKHDLSVSGNIIVDGSSWGDAKKFSEKMRVCEQAAKTQSCLSIDYISREGVHSKRVIDPHLLIFKRNVWYVYAFCHSKQEFRTFKIGRIKNATFTGEKFKKMEFNREELDLDFYYPTENLLDIMLEIDKATLSDAEEWLGIDNIEPRGNNFIARISLPDDEWLVNKILSFGGAVKVLEPQSLNERVISAAKKVIALSSLSS
jgi:predicted DNA-binding transcriptional regulator YafY